MEAYEVCGGAGVRVAQRRRPRLPPPRRTVPRRRGRAAGALTPAQSTLFAQNNSTVLYCSYWHAARHASVPSALCSPHRFLFFYFFFFDSVSACHASSNGVPLTTAQACRPSMDRRGWSREPPRRGSKTPPPINGHRDNDRPKSLPLKARGTRPTHWPVGQVRAAASSSCHQAAKAPSKAHTPADHMWFARCGRARLSVRHLSPHCHWWAPRPLAPANPPTPPAHT